MSIGRSPVYTPVLSHTPTSPLSKSRRKSKPSETRASNPSQTVRVIRLVTQLTARVTGLATLTTHFSCSNLYRSEGITWTCLTIDSLLNDNVSPTSTLYHTTAYEIEWSPMSRCPSRLSMGCWRPTTSPVRTFVCVWNMMTMDLNPYQFNNEAEYWPGV